MRCRRAGEKRRWGEEEKRRRGQIIACSRPRAPVPLCPCVPVSPCLPVSASPRLFLLVFLSSHLPVSRSRHVLFSSSPLLPFSASPRLRVPASFYPLTSAAASWISFQALLDVPPLGVGLTDRHPQHDLPVKAGVREVDLAGSVEAIEDLLVGRVAADGAGSRRDSAARGPSARNADRRPPRGRTPGPGPRAARIFSCSPSTPKLRITNQSFSARNRRPSGTCQSR